MPPHPLNWQVGWGMILAAFVTGAGIGLFFHDEAFWGGYASFRRRIVRLGHIALAALGSINVLFGLSPWPEGDIARWASWCWIAGGLSMPAVCFLSGWRKPLRHLFFIPVIALVLAAVMTLQGSQP